MIIDYMLAFNILNASLPLLVDLYENEFRMEDRREAFPKEPSNLNLPTRETFDFIIVGGGTAGLVTARRLSEVFNVLVLEWGGNPPPLESVPSLSQSMKFIPSIHHLYESTPQKNAALSSGGLNPAPGEKSCCVESSGFSHLVRDLVRASAGKMLGGSSSHNSGQYERGSPHDFDHWATLTGDDSWSYKNVLKFFLKSENYNGRFSTKDGQHRTGGLLNVMTPNVTFRDDIWFSAAKDLGYEVGDSNGPQKIGFSPAEYNWKNGRRVSSYTGFIKDVEETDHEETLTVRRYSIVSEILFENTTAVGVLYYRHGVPSVAFASKEVILSAGAYISPIILMKSGIGPKEQLEATKKKPIAILPVGQNMEDHVVLKMPQIFVQDSTIFKYSNLTFQDSDTFLKTGEGPLSFDSMHEAFLASTRATKIDGRPDWSDIQLYLRQKTEPNHPQSLSLTCTVNLNRPASRGSLTYNTSAQKLEESLMPVIDYNFYDDPSDIEVMLEGMDFCQKIVDTPTFQSFGATFDPVPIPECKLTLLFGKREYQKCYLRHRSDTNFHVTSTNRMGHVDDPMAVVDSKLRVRGVNGLRVVDASIMPSVTNANIQAPVIMIAEKAAAEILLAYDAGDGHRRRKKKMAATTTNK